MFSDRPSNAAGTAALVASAAPDLQTVASGGGQQPTKAEMRIKAGAYVDWNSPGTMSASRGEREEEPSVDEIEVPDDLPPRLRAVVNETPYRPSEPLLLPAERFSGAPAAPLERRLIEAPTAPEDTGRQSRTVRMRLSRSCAGWRRQPTSREFYEALRAESPTDRERAILEAWATEADWQELLKAWTEDAYTFRQLASALHRAGLPRCRAAGPLNSWASQPEKSGTKRCPAQEA